MGVDLERLRANARDERGRYRAGHLGNVRSGLRVAPDHPALVDAFGAEHGAIVRDLGGAEHLTAMEAGLARELARVTVLVAATGENLLALGVVTAKGASRAMLAVYSGLLDRQARLAGQLGLARRSKPAGPTHLRDYIG